MSNSSVVLDTNAAVAIMNGDPTLGGLLGTSVELHLPVIVLDELYFGAERSARVAENLARVESLRTQVTVVAVQPDAAKEFGRLNQLLRKRGTPIPENDMWIACVALRLGFPLATRDAHFRNVDGLHVITW